jgi:hypothetical protein
MAFTKATLTYAGAQWKVSKRRISARTLSLHDQMAVRKSTSSRMTIQRRAASVRTLDKIFDTVTGDSILTAG